MNNNYTIMNEITNEGGGEGEGCLMQAVRIGGLAAVSLLAFVAMLAVIF